MGYNEYTGWASFDDNNTSFDNLHTLMRFFDLYPDLRSWDIYLAGESYAGIYVPYLALRILEHNYIHPVDYVNLQGIMIGNGVTHWKYDCAPALMEMAYAHGLIDINL